jgi:hypothetical protein
MTHYLHLLSFKMPVKTRSMTKASFQNIEVADKKSVKNNSMTSQKKKSTNLFVYKDYTTGIKYITEEHIQIQGLSNKFYTQNKIHILGLKLYEKITEIHPRYLKTIPKEVADRKDLFALAPEGYLWVKDYTGTSYFDLDEWKSLKCYSYKRGAEFNICLYS